MIPILKTKQFLSIIFLCLMLISSFPGQSQESEKKSTRPKVALVLSGGGAKGFAHIGVLKVLEEEGIPVDLIVGTSMGSLVGGIYSIGYNASELETLVKSLNWETILSDDVSRFDLSQNDQLLKQRYFLSLPFSGENKPSLPQGMIRGQNVMNVFCGLAGNVPANADFSQFPIAFACVSTNLETGKEVVIKDGFLPTAMFASMAIPIAFQSAERDDCLLVDGGLVNNFPTDVAKKMGADIIIGVDIRNDYFDRDKLKSFDNVIGQLIGFFDQAKDSINNSYCNVIIQPDITSYSMASFNNVAADSLIRRGERATLKVRTQLKELKEKYHLEPREKSRKLIKPDQWNITEINFDGNYHLDNDFLRKTLNLQIPGKYSSEDIKNAIDRIYGLGGFDRIYFSIADAENGKALNLKISTRKVFTQNIGFKANTTDAAAILINITRKNYRNVFGFLSGNVELSANPSLSFTAESNRTNLPTAGVSFKGKYQNYNVFDHGDKVLKTNIFYTSGAIYAYQPFHDRFTLGLGLQEEYYHGDIFRKSSDSGPFGKMDLLLTSAYSYLSFDNIDDFYFPTKGTNMYAEFSLTADFKRTSKLSPVGLFKIRNVIPLEEKTSLLLDCYARALFSAEYPLSRVTLVGGEPYSQYFNYHLPFVGLAAVNLADRFAYIGLLGIRTKVAKNQYLSFLLNGLFQDSDVIFRNGVNAIYGGGVRYSIKTMLGPLDMTVGYSGSGDKLTFSANFGYWF